MVQIKGQVVMSFHPKQLESAHLTRSAPSPHLGSLRHGGVPRLVLCSALKRGVEASAEGRDIRDIYFGVILTGTGTTDFGIPGIPSDEKR
jgi:hypothetical protein